MSSTEQHFTVQQVANQLSVSTDTILRMIRGGRLKAVNLRPDAKKACFRISQSDIDDLFADLQSESQQPAKPKPPRKRRRANKPIEQIV